MSAFGRRRNAPVIELIEYAHRAVAAAQAPDAVDRVVGRAAVEIGEPMRVGAGEIPDPLEDVVADHRLPAERSSGLRGAQHIGLASQRAGRRHQRNA